MALSVRRCDLLVGNRELGLTRDAYTKSVLRDWLRTQLAWATPVSLPGPPNLQAAVDDFAEFRTEGAVDSLSAYFLTAPLSGFTPGGRRASSVALVYPKRQLAPPTQHVGVVGEGVAGFYLEQHESLRLLVRPFGLTPDMVLYDGQRRRLALAEIKTSLQPGRQSFPLTTAIQLLDLLAKVKFMRKSLYVGYIVNVGILSPTDFELDVLRLEEV